MSADSPKPAKRRTCVPSTVQPSGLMEMDTNSSHCMSVAAAVESGDEKSLRKQIAKIDLQEQPQFIPQIKVQNVSQNDTDETQHGARSLGGSKHITDSTASILSNDSGIGSRHTSTANTPGQDTESSNQTSPQLVECHPLLEVQGSGKDDPPNTDQEQDGPFQLKHERKCDLSLPLKERKTTAATPHASIRTRSLSDSRIPFLMKSLSDGQLLKTTIRRKNASQLTKEDEKKLEEAVTKHMKDFTRLTDFVTLLACLYSTRLICSPDAEYLTSDNYTPRQKANHFYMTVLPTKGPKTCRLLYESLSEEYEHRGHRQLLHILDEAVGYKQDSTTKHNVRYSSPESSDGSPRLSAAMVYSSSDESNDGLAMNRSQALYGRAAAMKRSDGSQE